MVQEATLKAPHVRQHIFVELAILVDKSHGRSGWSRWGHNCSSHLSQDNASSFQFTPDLTEEGLEAFSAALRTDVNLEDLCRQLLTVVQETMQPEHVSLWLRQPARNST